MSESDLRSQISAKEDQIIKIEEEAVKKESAAEKEINNEYNSKISEVKSNLESEQVKFDEAIKNAIEWANKKKESEEIVKTFTKEYKLLVKEKDRKLKSKLKEIENNKKSQIKPLESEIKKIRKQLTALEKTKDQD